MEGVDLFFENLEGSKKELALSLHQFILSYQGISPKIRYNIPFYIKNTWICYLNVPKKGGVELAFIRANKFQESQSLLDFKDRKMVGSFTYSNKGEVDFEKIDAVMREALLLDKTKKYSIK